MALEVFHHSRLLRFRNPQGACPTGEQIRLALYTGEAFADAQAIVRLWVHGKEQLVPMQKTQACNGAWFHAMVRLPEEAGLVWYFFLLQRPGGAMMYYGGESGEGALLGHEPQGYQITVYERGFETPRWFREGIMYQIFPDRFRRGGDAQKGIGYHRGKGRTLHIHEDWNEQPAYQPAAGEQHYTPNDFYCGDLRGIRDSLKYLHGMGIRCIYLNPVFESGSNHRYDTADYRRIDPLLGSNADFIDLCAEAKRLGMRIMLDGVFSHTGADSVYFNKYGRYDTIGAWQSKDSPYRPWYHIDASYPYGYRTWWGFPELPEVEEADASYNDFVMGEEDSLLAFWAAHGATSWRLDVADELPDRFIAGLRKRLKALDPDGVLLGEVWEDASNKEAYGERRAYALGKELDSAMNYPFCVGVRRFLLHEEDAYALNQLLQTQRERYPLPFYYAAMNMLSTHDSVRALTALSGAPHREALSREQQAMFVPTAEALALGKRRLLAATALQMTLPGVPCIYYGDEVGLTGMADPFNRGTFPWDGGDIALRDGIHRLAQARAQHPALQSGFCRMGALSADVFAIVRYTSLGRNAFGEQAKPDTVLCLCNRSDSPQTLCFTLEDLPEGPDCAQPVSLQGDYIELCTGQEWTCMQAVVEAVVPPCGALLLAKRNHCI